MLVAFSGRTTWCISCSELAWDSGTEAAGVGMKKGIWAMKWRSRKAGICSSALLCQGWSRTEQWFLNHPRNLQQRSSHHLTKRHQRALPKESLPKWGKSLSSKCCSSTKHTKKKYWNGEEKGGLLLHHLTVMVNSVLDDCKLSLAF